MPRPMPELAPVTSAFLPVSGFVSDMCPHFATFSPHGIVASLLTFLDSMGSASVACLQMTSLVIHGHFYQPPRENPWTDVLERQPSAHPDHDWNTRIHRECYRPNAYARIYGEYGRVDVVFPITGERASADQLGHADVAVFPGTQGAGSRHQCFAGLQVFDAAQHRWFHATQRHQGRIEL